MKYLLQSCYIVFLITINATAQADCLLKNNCEIGEIKLNDSYELVKKKLSPCKESVEEDQIYKLDCIKHNKRRLVFFGKDKKAYRIHNVINYKDKQDYKSIRKQYLALYGQPTLEAEARTTPRNSSKGLIREMCWGECRKKTYKKPTSSNSFSKSNFWSGSTIPIPKQQKTGKFLLLRYSEQKKKYELLISIVDFGVHHKQLAALIKKMGY